MNPQSVDINDEFNSFERTIIHLRTVKGSKNDMKWYLFDSHLPLSCSSFLQINEQLISQSRRTICCTLQAVHLAAGLVLALNCSSKFCMSDFEDHLRVQVPRQLLRCKNPSPLTDTLFFVCCFRTVGLLSFCFVVKSESSINPEAQNLNPLESINPTSTLLSSLAAY